VEFLFWWYGDFLKQDLVRDKNGCFGFGVGCNFANDLCDCDLLFQLDEKLL
jgi:hypothetical protein